MTKIIIADDHPIIRNRIRQILSEEKDMEVICEASSGEELLQLRCTEVADVLVLDFNLTDMNAFELLPRIKAKHPSLPVLILSAMSDGMFTKKLMSYGASGFVSKESASEDLARSIRQVMSR